MAASSLEPFLHAWPGTIPALAAVLRSQDGTLRVSPWKRLQNSDLPAITFQKVGDTAIGSLSGLSGLRADSYQLSVWARTQREARSIAALVRGRKGQQGLDRYRGTLAGVTVRACFCTDDRDMPVPPDSGDDIGIPAVQLDFHVWWEDVSA